MAEDKELLCRYVTRHSEAAFAELVQRHVALVYHAALRRLDGNTALAEEVTQAVFTSLARQAPSLQRHTALAGWLYTATRHAAGNVQRGERRRKAREQEASTMHEASLPAPSDAEWARLRSELDSVLDELSQPDRDAVLLRFFENRPYVQVGLKLNISEDAARMRVERALERMRTLLGRRGVTSTAAALGGLLAAQSALAAPAGLAASMTSAALAAGATAVPLGWLTFMTTNKMMAAITAARLSLVAGWHFLRPARRNE